MFSKLTRAAETVRRYASLAGWLAWDSLYRYKKQAALVLAADPMGVMLQVQAIGLAVFYGRALVNDNTVSLLGHSIELRHSVFALAAVAVAVFVLLLLAAAFSYLAHDQAIRLVRRYEEFCISRVISTWGSQVVVMPTPETPVTNRTALMRTARQDARYMGVVTRGALRMIAPVVTFLVAVSVLFLIHIWLTLATMAAMTVAVYFQARVSLFAASRSMELERYADTVRVRFQQVLDWQEGFPALGPDEDWLQQHIIGANDVQRWRDAYDSRFRIGALSELISNTSLAVAVLLMFLLLGPAMIGGYADFGLLAAYLIALRYAVVNMRGVARQLTIINRFYPHVLRYRNVSRLVTLPAAVADAAAPVAVKSTDIEIPGVVREWRIERGQRIGVLCPFRVSRFELGLLLAILFGEDESMMGHVMGALWFVNKEFGAPPVENLPALEQDAKDHANFLPQLAQLAREACLTFRSMNDPKRRTPRWEPMDDALKVALCVVAGLHYDPQFLFVADTALAALPVPARDELLEYGAERVMFIVSSDVEVDFSAAGVRAVVVVDDQQVLGVFPAADFLLGRDAIRDRFTAGLEARGGLVSDVGDTMMDEEF